MACRTGNQVPAMMIGVALWGMSVLGCSGMEAHELICQTLSSTGIKTRNAISSGSGSLLVVMTYGYGCSGSGPGNGLRDLAKVIRERYSNARVITRAWNDRDNVAQIIEQFPGHVVLVGHSFGGCKSIELATRVRRRVDWLILLDPVPSDDWAFRRSGRYFQIPASVGRAVCYHRPPSFPVSYPILNPRSPGDNRERHIGHSSFCGNAEVHRCILNVCAMADGGATRTAIADVGE